MDVDPISLFDNTVDQSLFTFVFSNKNFNLTDTKKSLLKNATQFVH